MLERGRGVKNRVLIASSPFLQQLEDPTALASSLGYQVRILARVQDAGERIDEGKRTSVDTTGGTSAGDHPRSESAGGTTKSGNPHCTNCGSIVRMGSGGLADTDSTSLPEGSEKITHREQAVDEVLQLWIYKAIVDGNKAPRNATIILATGDGKGGKFNKGGYIDCVRSALNKGWRVELYAWENTLNPSWSKHFGRDPLFKSHTLDKFVDLLVL